MEDSELRSALLAFFEGQNKAYEKFAEDLTEAQFNVVTTEEVLDKALLSQARFLELIQSEGKKLIAALGTGVYSSSAVKKPETTERGNERAAEEAFLRAAAQQEREDSPSLTSFELSLVETYNDEPEKWQQRFRPKVFGAENVNELWEKGGEPRFVTKEGGIYSLVENQGSYYVVPEPGFRLSERYFKTEGVGYLFETGNMDIEDSPVIRLVKPAKVSDCGGRFTVVSKGSIRRRN